MIKKRFRELWGVTFPIVVEQVFIALMGLVNTALVASLGEQALSASGLVNNASNLLIALMAALTTGGTIVVAHAAGAKDKEKASVAGAQAISLSAAFSVLVTLALALWQKPVMALLFGDSEALMVDAGHIYYIYINGSFPLLAITQTIFGVLRGCGDTATPMKVSLLMNIINFLLGYLLIVGLQADITLLGFALRFGIPSLGMHGAGLAMVLARAVGLAASAYVILFRTTTLRLNQLSCFRPDFPAIKMILNLGVPTSVESTLFQAGRLITQLFIVGMGTAAMAANTVASAIFGFVNVPGNAMSMSVMILVGQRVGRKETDDIYKTSLFTVLLGILVMLAICLVMLPTGGLLASIYKLDGPTAEIFQTLLLSCYIATPLFWPASFVTPAALRATGDVKFTMVSAILSMWVFRIGIGYVFGVLFQWGAVGVWFGMYADWLVRSFLFLLRLHGGQWKRFIKTADKDGD